MRINHNIAALNTYRQLTMGTNAASKSMEKLSSGLRINRAGDDAAGLAISEKMRGQIRGLEMAAKNAQDAISLIQTAEGALNETHSILQRMRELAVQASNDTTTDADRKELQKEVDQLAEELSRIASTTEFNTQKLLNGTFSGTFHIGANESQNLKVSIGDMSSFALGVAGSVKTTITEGDNTTLTVNGKQDIADGTYNVIETSDPTQKYQMKDSNGNVVAYSTDGKSWTVNVGEKDDVLTFSAAVTSGDVTFSGNFTKVTATASFTNKGLQAGTYTYDGVNKVLKDVNGNVVAFEDSSNTGLFKDIHGNTVLDASAEATAGVVFANGDTFTVEGINITSQTTANVAITKINDAIEKVSAERAKLGAYQNRLEHTINNLGTSAENLTAAESRIRDVDMAKEMMEFTKNNILTQAAQAMLAQANQQPQGVLQLLR
ncbi:flagellar hook-associated protein FlgL [Geobacillus zalihae]|uniref:flagellar hook-associated protein FlgL n=1 Tax=Geobacillus zalihae TaxID=213419 RepID=UPI001680D044|nr:flagellar hook-associated protein FlgL [Geobacillus zalihae]QNU26255.1 flagellar hook-associated protein FlgL [Geobacillus zalihae]